MIMLYFLHWSLIGDSSTQVVPFNGDNLSLYQHSHFLVQSGQDHLVFIKPWLS